MILQYGARNPIAGESLPGAEITISFLGKVYHAHADADGRWQALLDSAEPGGPFTMEVSAGDTAEVIYIKGIYIGDVWLCSGQSNMELSMERLKDDFPEEWTPPVNSLIRQFKIPQEWDFSGPHSDLRGGSWTAASPDTLHAFSGTAWFFARTIFEKYKTPIGLIHAAMGGTPVESWMSGEALSAFPGKLALAAQYADPACRDAAVQANLAEIAAWEDTAARQDRGLDGQWQRPETDIAEWNVMRLPGHFAGAGLDRFCGVIWLRRTFDAPERLAGRAASVWLGTITDADTVFINGVEVGKTTYRYPPRKYVIPAGLLHAGENTIVARVVCCSGDGGVTRDKAFRVFGEGCRIELAGEWNYCVGMRAASVRPAEFFPQRLPTGLFNAMIAPVLRRPFTGVIWYQGESNEGNPGEYAALFTAMIQDWRKKNRREDLPFIFVQLPLFGEPEENDEASSWAAIREAQLSALSLPATGMAAGLDLGEWNDLHPINKKDIGRRLALAAESVVFKNSNTAPGPLPRSVQRRKGRLVLTFDKCGKGLAAREKPYVSVVAGGTLVRLPADIESPECLSVDISSVEKPERILYAWANNPRDRQLYNADGLPVIPFRADIAEAAS
jgi:sialate O-acetylesterase